MRPVLLMMLISIISACTSSRYQHQYDFTPPTSSELKPEPVPKAEPRSVLGNPTSYEVLGQRYQVLQHAFPFEQQGIASWYGMKFHGHQTSNGEIYDVYAFTAAHKTLPLPSYVRVTRTDSGASVVVRVNDRGPFHPGRIIDLSYAAAIKLNMHEQGTAPVRIEVLQPPHAHSERWLQLAALTEATAALALQQKVTTLLNGRWPVTITKHHRPQQTTVHRVRIGPVKEGEELTQLQQLLQREGIDAMLLAAHQ